MQELLHSNKIGTNGKLSIKLSRKTSSYLYNNKKVVFKTGKDNLFLMEYRVNSPHPNPDRKFALSIRQDGYGEYEGQHRLSQISLSIYDLVMLRDGLDAMINAEYQQ